MKKPTLKEVKQNPDVKKFLDKTDRYLEKLGFTEHGSRHANITANIAKNILLRLGYAKEGAELAAIAGYLHDIGSVVNRKDHAQSSAMIAFTLLYKKMPTEDLIRVLTAIGNHHEESSNPANLVSAAVIIADKADVHRSRVKNKNPTTFDIHDRVNYATKKSKIIVNKQKRTIKLDLAIDTKTASIMDYFEIFMNRMTASRRAAKFLNCKLELYINNNKIM